MVMPLKFHGNSFEFSGFHMISWGFEHRHHGIQSDFYVPNFLGKNDGVQSSPVPPVLTGTIQMFTSVGWSSKMVVLWFYGSPSGYVKITTETTGKPKKPYRKMEVSETLQFPQTMWVICRQLPLWYFPKLRTHPNMLPTNPIEFEELT